MKRTHYHMSNNVKHSRIQLLRKNVQGRINLEMVIMDPEFWRIKGGTSPSEKVQKFVMRGAVR